MIAKLKSFNREVITGREPGKLPDKIERIEKLTEDNTDIRIAGRMVSGNDVLKVVFAKAFPPLQLFSGINFEVKRGSV